MRKTTAEFITQANRIHGGEYDYSNTVYINNSTKISIICKTHGEFQQLPTNHLKGTKCKRCALEKRTNTLTSFIEAAKKVHHDSYDYSSVEYVNNYTDVSILCTIHGPFSQRPNNHLNGAGCPKCAKQQRLLTNQDKYLSDYPIQSIGIKHKRQQNNIAKYGTVSPSKLESIKNKVKQTCLARYGTTNVLQIPTIRDKIKQTNIEKYGVDNFSHTHLVDCISILNDYDWLFDQYITQNKTSLQIANELSIGSSTTVCNYLRKYEIEIRQSYKQSYKAIQWLDSIMKSENIHIQHSLNGGEYQIPNTKYKADGYCKETNTVYEFYGDYWHGNPEVYDSELMNESTNCTMNELYQKTIEREQKIRELGYELISIWEHKYINN